MKLIDNILINIFQSVNLSFAPLLQCSRDAIPIKFNGVFKSVSRHFIVFEDFSLNFFSLFVEFVLDSVPFVFKLFAQKCQLFVIFKVRGGQFFLFSLKTIIIMDIVLGQLYLKIFYDLIHFRPVYNVGGMCFAIFQYEFGFIIRSAIEIAYAQQRYGSKSCYSIFESVV